MIEKLKWPKKEIFSELKKLEKSWLWPWQSSSPELEREMELQKNIITGKDIVEKINEIIEIINK